MTELAAKQAQTLIDRFTAIPKQHDTDRAKWGALALWAQDVLAFLEDIRKQGA